MSISARQQDLPRQADRMREEPPAARARPGSGPTSLVRLFVEQGQSVWLDQLDRASLEDGTLGRLVAAGVRGVTADPAPLHSAAGYSSAYQEQLSWLFSEGWLLDKVYLELAATDVRTACDVLLPL